MKNFMFSLILGGALLLALPNAVEAQVSVQVNIGHQPVWGPSGYNYARYYYLPEIDVYYDVVTRRYTYFQGRRWVTKSRLPGMYRHIDLYRTYKVVVNDRNPWNNHRYYRTNYGRYASNYRQVNIRDYRNAHPNYGRNERPGRDYSRPPRSSNQREYEPRHRNNNSGKNNKVNHRKTKEQHRGKEQQQGSRR